MPDLDFSHLANASSEQVTEMRVAVLGTAEIDRMVGHMRASRETAESKATPTVNRMVAHMRKSRGI
ncbi:hypothetical protein [Acidisoma silvae]|uniref:Uncharacterized protein n=1 Tax=Acidisoma silvae TaxID=2802396 RepID=A0A963YV50_9PROT|nr:hypothetical protein [Acidisoma silvae]MCB8877594.1 hypothetical protein [Acidisoma silvae]